MSIHESIQCRRYGISVVLQSDEMSRQGKSDAVARALCYLIGSLRIVCVYLC